MPVFCRSFSAPYRLVPVVLLAATLGLLAQPVLAQAEPSNGGSFILVYEPAKTDALKPIEQMLREAQLFDVTVDELNETLGLPTDLEIVFLECGTVNAFYSSEETRILMCYELVQFFAEQFGSLYEKEEEIENAVTDATIFVFHHELGHALVHLLEIPITGKEEDAVDDLATLVLLHEWEGGADSALNAAESFYMMGEAQETSPDETAVEQLPYYDEHSLGKQRYYQIACIVYGSNPEEYANLVGEALPEGRAVRCPSEYQQKATSWERLLADHYAAGEPEDAEEDAGDGDAGGDEEGGGEDEEGGGI